MKHLAIGAIVAIYLLGLLPALEAHCEIPCGIYDDPMRAELIAEHAETIEKSMRKIKELREEDDKNYNQLVRWIDNKEDHANKLQEIVSQYFMTQRISPASEESDEREKYVREVTLLQRMLVEAMKCKQTTDEKHVENLRELLGEFEDSYFEDDPQHEHEHGHDKHTH